MLDHTRVDRSGVVRRIADLHLEALRHPRRRGGAERLSVFERVIEAFIVDGIAGLRDDAPRLAVQFHEDETLPRSDPAEIREVEDPPVQSFALRVVTEQPRHELHELVGHRAHLESVGAEVPDFSERVDDAELSVRAETEAARMNPVQIDDAPRHRTANELPLDFVCGPPIEERPGQILEPLLEPRDRVQLLPHNIGVGAGALLIH